MDTFQHESINGEEFKEVPSAKKAGITEERFRELVVNPVRNKVALMELISDLDHDLSDNSGGNEHDEKGRDVWKNTDALKSMVSGAIKYLAGQSALLIYAEHAVIAVFNDVVAKADNCRKKVDSLKIQIESSKETISPASVADLVSQSKRLALLEMKIEKSLMAHQYITAQKVVSLS